MEDDNKLFEEFLAFKKFKESQEISTTLKPSTKQAKEPKRTKYKKRADGRYSTSVTVGRDEATGKVIKIKVYGKTIAELEDNVLNLKLDKKNGIDFYNRKLTLKEYTEKWFATKKLSISYKTILMYEQIMRNHFYSVDNLPVKDIKKLDLQEIINKNISKARTCQQIRMVFKEVFESAIDDGIILKNPAKRLVIPTYKAKEKRCLTNDEDFITETTILTDRERAFVIMIKYFGLRKEEALALRKDNFDFKEKVICIKNAVIFINNRPILKSTKNGDERYIPIVPSIVSFLKYYISNIENEWLFTSIKGASLITESSFKKMWISIMKKFTATSEKFNKKLGLDITPHLFRHNYACMLMYAGVDMKERQYLLGHKTIAMTMDIYTHIEKQKMKAPKQLADFVSNSLKELQT